MNRAAPNRCRLVSGFAALLMAIPAAAQTLPATSASAWFYSPDHYPPFHQFGRPDRKPLVLIPLLRSRRDDAARPHEQPC